MVFQRTTSTRETGVFTETHQSDCVGLLGCCSDCLDNYISVHGIAPETLYSCFYRFGYENSPILSFHGNVSSFLKIHQNFFAPFKSGGGLLVFLRPQNTSSNWSGNASRFRNNLKSLILLSAITLSDHMLISVGNNCDNESDKVCIWSNPGWGLLLLWHASKLY